MEHAAAGRRPRAPTAPGPAPSTPLQGSLGRLHSPALRTTCAGAKVARTLQGHEGGSEEAGSGAGLLQVLRPECASSHPGQALGKIGPPLLLSRPTPNSPASLPIPGSFLDELRFRVWGVKG